MKVAILVCAIALCSAARVPRQAGPSVDIASSMLNQLATVTSQIQAVQVVLADLSAQMSRMLVTGSRLVTGLDDQAQSQSQGPNVAGSALGVFTQLTTQLQAAQRVLADLNAQLNTIVASSTRLVSGQDAAGPASGFDNVLQTLNSVTGQLQALQRVLTDLSSQFNRMVTTGSRLVSGQNAGEATNPAAAIFAGLAQVTNQFASVQTVLTDLSAQLNQLVATSSRLVSGQQADGAPAGPQPPTDQALSALQQVTSQFAAIQRVLTDLSSQLNRMVETGSRLVTSG